MKRHSLDGNTELLRATKDTEGLHSGLAEPGKSCGGTQLLMESPHVRHIYFGDRS